MNDDSMTIDQHRLDRNWRAISAELAIPRPARIERMLHGIGVPRRHVRVILATPSLRRAWYLAITIAVLVGLGATSPEEPVQSLFTLLVLAPLVPVLGVAMAYGPGADPMYEVQMATPLTGIRLVMIRAVTVLTVSIMVIVGLSMFSDVARPMAAAWLLPAVALTVGSLAAMTVLSPRRATTLVAVVWVVGAFSVRAIADDQLAAFRPVGQLICAVAAALLAGVVYARRERFDRLQVAT